MLATATSSPMRTLQVMDAALNFIRRRIGEGQPYVAAHVRPYPDPCLKVWTMASESNQTVSCLPLTFVSVLCIPLCHKA